MLRTRHGARARRWAEAVAASAALTFAGGASADTPKPRTAARAAPSAVPHGPGSLTGIWTNDDYVTSGIIGPRAGVLRTADGQLPPMRPEVAALLEKRVQDAEAGHPFETTMSKCLPAGFPNMMFGPRLPIEIVETPGQVTILVTPLMNYRIIRLNQKHAEDPDPTYFGDAVGHWEGDTLVVDTIALKDTTTLDPTGMPHSAALHTVERFRRTAEKTLELSMTIEDSATFTKPWVAKTKFTTDPDMEMSEYFCENNRNLAGGRIQGLSGNK